MMYVEQNEGAFRGMRDYVYIELPFIGKVRPMVYGEYSKKTVQESTFLRLRIDTLIDWKPQMGNMRKYFLRNLEYFNGAFTIEKTAFDILEDNHVPIS